MRGRNKIETITKLGTPSNNYNVSATHTMLALAPHTYAVVAADKVFCM